MRTIDYYRWVYIIFNTLPYPTLPHSTPRHSHSIVPCGVINDLLDLLDNNFGFAPILFIPGSPCIRDVDVNKRRIELFEGRKRVHNADEIMAEIVARRRPSGASGFVVMKHPPI